MEMIMPLYLLYGLTNFLCHLKVHSHDYKTFNIKITILNDSHDNIEIVILASNSKKSELYCLLFEMKPIQRTRINIKLHYQMKDNCKISANFD